MTNTTSTTTQQGEIKAGTYKGYFLDPAKEGYTEEAYGDSTNGVPELLIRVRIPELSIVVTTPLYFSPTAQPHSITRLRAGGWTGEDLSDLTGVDKNEVDVTLSYETYDGKRRARWQTGSAGGAFKTSNPVAPKSWAAKVAALTGVGTATTPTGAPKPPF